MLKHILKYLMILILILLIGFIVLEITFSIQTANRENIYANLQRVRTAIDENSYDYQIEYKDYPIGNETLVIPYRRDSFGRRLVDSDAKLESSKHLLFFWWILRVW